MPYPLIGAAILSNEPTTSPTGPFDAFRVARVIGCDFVRARVILKWPLTDLAWLDSVADQAQASGLKLVVTWWVDGGTKRGDTSTVTLEQYGEACARLAGRYSGRVYAWTIENEPDQAGLFPEEYANRVAIAVPRFKAGDPAAKIVAGELALEGERNRRLMPQYVRAIAATGIRPDAISCHAYDGYRNQWPAAFGAPAGMRAKVAWLKTEISAAFGGPLPVWLTEVGSPSGPDGPQTFHSPELQAKVVRRVLVESATAGVDAVAWYRLADQTGEPEAQQWGLFRSDGAPKLGFYDWARILPVLKLGLPAPIPGDLLGPDRIGRRF